MPPISTKDESQILTMLPSQLAGFFCSTVQEWGNIISHARYTINISQKLVLKRDRRKKTFIGFFSAHWEYCIFILSLKPHSLTLEDAHIWNNDRKQRFLGTLIFYKAISVNFFTSTLKKNQLIFCYRLPFELLNILDLVSFWYNSLKYSILIFVWRINHLKLQVIMVSSCATKCISQSEIKHHFDLQPVKHTHNTYHKKFSRQYGICWEERVKAQSKHCFKNNYYKMNAVFIVRKNQG